MRTCARRQASEKAARPSRWRDAFVRALTLALTYAVALQAIFLAWPGARQPVQAAGLDPFAVICGVVSDTGPAGRAPVQTPGHIPPCHIAAACLGSACCEGMATSAAIGGDVLLSRTVAHADRANVGPREPAFRTAAQARAPPPMI